MVWSVAGPPSIFRADPMRLDSGRLVDETLHLIRHWSADLRRLVEHAVPNSAVAFPFVFPAALESWNSRRVTLLGDAIHPMPPTAGLGASTAIIDAVTLANQLAVSSNVTEALQAYQSKMLEYAPLAVDEARPPLAWQKRFSNPWIRIAAMNVLLPITDVVVQTHGRVRKKFSM